MEIEQLPRFQPPRLFRPHPNLSDEVNRHLVQSQIEGGVRVEDLVPGSRLQVKTQNTCYRILILFGAMALITGPSVVLPSSSLDHHSRINLGRFNAQGALHRSGYAPGISSPGLQHAYRHFPYPGNSGITAAQGIGDRGSGVVPSFDLLLLAL